MPNRRYRQELFGCKQACGGFYRADEYRSCRQKAAAARNSDDNYEMQRDCRPSRINFRTAAAATLCLARRVAAMAGRFVLFRSCHERAGNMRPQNRRAKCLDSYELLRRGGAYFAIAHYRDAPRQRKCFVLVGVTIMKVMPTVCCKLTNSARIKSRNLASKADSGSSKSNTFGFLICAPKQYADARPFCPDMPRQMR